MFRRQSLGGQFHPLLNHSQFPRTWAGACDPRAEGIGLAVLADGDPDWRPGAYRAEVGGLIEWLTRLPPKWELRFRDDLAKFEAREGMTTTDSILSTIEVAAMDKGRRQGLRQGVQRGAQQGLRRGRQKGLERGSLIGGIRVCQELMGLPPTPRGMLARRKTEVLCTELHALQAQVRNHVR